MHIIGTFLRGHRTLAMLLLALVLCVKAVVPQGYMVGSGQRLLTVQLCHGGGGGQTSRITIPIRQQSAPDTPLQGGAPDQHCAFTSLSMGMLGGADAPLLEQALIFLIARGFAPVTAVLPERLSYLLPPLRGPPSAL